MAGKQIAGDGVPPSLAGMSKNQLYDIMSQMKTLIEQNKQQARQVLIQNPVLTRALFQAQIMLGMVQPPQASPAIQSTASQIPNPQPPPISNQKPTIQPPSSFLGQTSPNHVRNQLANQIQSQNPNQTMVPRNPHPQPAPPNPQSQPALSRPLQPQQQPKAHLAAQSTQMSMPPGPPQSSQALNISQLPSQLTNLTQLPQHSVFQPSVPSLPPQSQQQPMQSSGNPYLPLQQPLQPPLPPHMRGPMPGFPHQVHGQMGPNMGFQHPGGPPMLNPQQHMFHASAKPHGGMGPGFPQGQLPHPPNQPLPPSLYQGGNPHLGMDYNQSGNSRQTDRGSNWTPGVQENPMGQLHRPPSFPGQVVSSSQPSRPDQQLTPELEKTLLQQVMSLTPEQINSMPPEHRNQILQLQQMLRQ